MTAINNLSVISLLFVRFLMKLMVVLVRGVFIFSNFSYILILLLPFLFEILFIRIRKLKSKRELLFFFISTSLVVFLPFLIFVGDVYLIAFIVLIDIICLLYFFYRWSIIFGIFLVFSLFSFNLAGFIIANLVDSFDDVSGLLEKGNLNIAKGKIEGYELGTIIYKSGEYIKTIFDKGEELTLFVRALPYEKEIIFVISVAILSILSLYLISALEVRERRKKYIDMQMQTEEKTNFVASSETIHNGENISESNGESIYESTSEIIDTELDNLKAKIENDRTYLDYLEKSLKDFEMYLQKFKAAPDMRKYLFDIVKKSEEVLSKKVDLKLDEVLELKDLILKLSENLKLNQGELMNFRAKVWNFSARMNLFFRGLEYYFHEIFSPLGGIENELQKLRLLFPSEQKGEEAFLKAFDNFRKHLEEFEKVLENFSHEINSSFENIGILAFNSHLLAYKIGDKARAFDPISLAIEELILRKMDAIKNEWGASYEGVKSIIRELKDIKITINYPIIDELLVAVNSIKNDIEWKISSIFSLISSNSQSFKKIDEALEKLSENIDELLSLLQVLSSLLDDGLKIIEKYPSYFEENKKFISNIRKVLDDLEGKKDNE
jgi:prefoldin subunit 5